MNYRLKFLFIELQLLIKIIILGTHEQLHKRTEAKRECRETILIILRNPYIIIVHSSVKSSALREP